MRGTSSLIGVIVALGLLAFVAVVDEMVRETRIFRCAEAMMTATDFRDCVGE